MRRSIDEMKDKGLLKMPLIASALIVAVFLGIVLGIGTPRFDVNDDVVMMHIASGDLTGQPDEHLVWQHFLAGKLLKWGYQVMPTINWYVVWLCGVHALAGCALLYLGISSGASKLQTWLFASGLAVFETFFLLNLQFTTTAFFSGFAGWACLLKFGRKGDGRGIVSAVAGVILLTCSVMIRSDAFFLSSLLLLPTILVLFLTGGESRRALLVRLGLIVVPLSVLFSEKAYLRADPEWKTYRDYAHIRQVIDRSIAKDYLRGAVPRSSEYDRKLGDLGWSRNDGLAYAEYLFIDQNVFSSEKLKELASIFKNTKRTRATGLQKLRSHLSQVRWQAISAGAIAFAVALGSFRSRRRLLIVGSVSTWLLVVAFALYLAMFRKIEIRVLVPLLTSFALLPCLFGKLMDDLSGAADGESEGKLFGVIQRWVAALAGAGVLYVAIDSGVKMSSMNAVAQESFGQVVEGFSKIKTKDGRPAVFVVWWGLPYELHPVEFLRKKGSEYQMLIIGWPVPGPLFKNNCDRFGVTDLLRDVYLRDDLVLICGPSHLRIYEIFIREHYGSEVEAHRVPVLDERGYFQVYKLRDANPSQPSAE